MKHVSTIIAALWVLCLVLTCVTAQAQSSIPADRSNSNQWISHQMNQPPPGSVSRTHSSQDRVEEIRRLYELAKKEAQYRARAATPGPR